jgi:hypothetical protein
MVTALGCFGGDFNIDNGLLLSSLCKMSDILSDKFSGVAMHTDKRLTRSFCEGGSDPTATVTHRASKGGVAPASSEVWAASFLVAVCFVISFLFYRFASLLR